MGSGFGFGLILALPPIYRLRYPLFQLSVDSDFLIAIAVDGSIPTVRVAHCAMNFDGEFEMGSGHSEKKSPCHSMNEQQGQ